MSILQDERSGELGTIEKWCKVEWASDLFWLSIPIGVFFITVVITRVLKLKWFTNSKPNAYKRVEEVEIELPELSNEVIKIDDECDIECAEWPWDKLSEENYSTLMMFNDKLQSKAWELMTNDEKSKVWRMFVKKNRKDNKRQFRERMKFKNLNTPAFRKSLIVVPSSIAYLFAAAMITTSAVVCGQVSMTTQLGTVNGQMTNYGELFHWYSLKESNGLVPGFYVSQLKANHISSCVCTNDTMNCAGNCSLLGKIGVSVKYVTKEVKVCRISSLDYKNSHNCKGGDNEAEDLKSRCDRTLGARCSDSQSRGDCGPCSFGHHRVRTIFPNWKCTETELFMDREIKGFIPSKSNYNMTLQIIDDGSYCASRFIVYDNLIYCVNDDNRLSENIEIFDISTSNEEAINLMMDHMNLSFREDFCDGTKRRTFNTLVGHVVTESCKFTSTVVGSFVDQYCNKPAFPDCPSVVKYSALNETHFVAHFKECMINDQLVNDIVLSDIENCDEQCNYGMKGNYNKNCGFSIPGSTNSSVIIPGKSEKILERFKPNWIIIAIVLIVTVILTSTLVKCLC